MLLNDDQDHGLLSDEDHSNFALGHCNICTAGKLTSWKGQMSCDGGSRSFLEVGGALLHIGAHAAISFVFWQTSDHFSPSQVTYTWVQVETPVEAIVPWIGNPVALTLVKGEPI